MQLFILTSGALLTVHQTDEINHFLEVSGPLNISLYQFSVSLQPKSRAGILVSSCLSVSVCLPVRPGISFPFSQSENCFTWELETLNKSYSWPKEVPYCFGVTWVKGQDRMRTVLENYSKI